MLATSHINSNPEYANLADLTNTLPFFAYLQDCNPGHFDIPQTDCFCEELTDLDYGGFAAVCFARSGGNTGFHQEFWDAIYSKGIYQIGDALADSREEFISVINTYRYCYYQQTLFGDPAAQLKMNNSNTLAL